MPNYGSAGRGPEARRRAVRSRSSRWSPLGRPQTRMLDDDWTVVTADGSRAAHCRAHGRADRGGPWVLTAAGRRRRAGLGALGVAVRRPAEPRSTSGRSQRATAVPRISRLGSLQRGLVARRLTRHLRSPRRRPCGCSGWSETPSRTCAADPLADPDHDRAHDRHGSMDDDGGYGEEGRRHRDRGHGRRAAAERHVPGRARATATRSSRTSAARCASTTSGSSPRTGSWWSSSRTT